MNLNSLKKGFKGTNPERGLHSLPGAQGSGREKKDEQSFRLSGKYISSNDYSIPKYIGMAAFTASCLSVLGMAGPMLIAMLGNDDFLKIIMPSLFLGLGLVHALAIFAESLKGGEITLARNSLKVFWIGLLATIILPAFSFVFPNI